MSLIFVDCEADINSPCPGLGKGMTEFGAVEFKSRQTFYGKIVNNEDWLELYALMVKFEKWLQQFEKPYVFVSDNPAYDWQWINYSFHHTIGRNPFGWSARRIGDFYAGLVGDFKSTSKWKRLRITKHSHNPVDDAMGNCEAFERMMNGEYYNKRR